MSSKGYTLTDAENYSANSPGFVIPSLSTRMKFESEDIVQLMFENDSYTPGAPPHEHMWVEVLEVPAPGRYIGSLDTHPIFVKGVRYGDTINFDARHIIKFINEDGQPDI